MASLIHEELRTALGAENVRDGEPERIAYSADLWPRSQIWKLGGDICRHPPECVVWPGSEAEVAAVLRICGRHGMPVIPYGAGSGVCGGTLPVRGGVVLDVRRMNRFLALHERDLTVTAEPGIIGMHLEEELVDRGYTLGHFPSSILCSTLGGWLAGRSAGQCSSKYGKIEDMVVSLRAVLADGSVLTTGPREPFDWTQVIVGSEGTLGVITEATLRVHPVSESYAFRGYRFRKVDDALRGIRLVMQSGLAPHVVRLYDPFDSLLQGGHRPDGGEALAEEGSGGLSAMLGPLRRIASGRVKASNTVRRAKLLGTAIALSQPGLLNRLIDALPVSCLLVIGVEGSREDADNDMQQARRLLADAGGVDGGDGPGLRWLRKRYAISFKQSPVFEAGAFVDTMEVATTWSRLSGLYDGVRRALSPHAMVMAHFSHAYREGCSIYFTFAAFDADPVALAARHSRAWDAALDAAVRAGATISHHHGVGWSKRDHMRREHGAGLRLLYGVKDALDPANIMNPGKVLPERDASTKRPLARRPASKEAPGEGPVRTGAVLAVQSAEDVSRAAGAAFTAGGRLALGVGQEGAVVIDPAGFAEVRQLDTVSGTVTVDAGATPRVLERILAEEGLTLGSGHFADPDAPLALSLAAGEGLPLVVSLEAVLPDGTVITTPAAPRRATGPNPDALLAGTESALALLTAATLRVRARPSAVTSIAYAGNGPALLETLRRLLASGVRVYYACLREGARARATVTVTLESERHVRRVQEALCGTGAKPTEPDTAPPPPYRPRRLGWSALDGLIGGRRSSGLYVGCMDLHGGEARAPGDVLCPGLDPRFEALRRTIDPHDVLGGQK